MNTVKGMCWEILGLNNHPDSLLIVYSVILVRYIADNYEGILVSIRKNELRMRQEARELIGKRLEVHS